MLWILQAVSERLRALFVADVALGLEAEVASRQAARKAELLRQAERYRAEGLTGVADELCGQADRLSLERPLASTAPATEELRRPLPAPVEDPADPAEPISLPSPPPVPRRALVPARPRRKKAG